MLPDILPKLSGEWKDMLQAADIQIAEPFNILKIAGAGGAHRKVNFLIFGHGATLPAVLLKQTRSRMNYERLTMEYESLMTVSSIPFMNGKMPYPIGLFQHDEGYILVESCIPGRSLDNLLLGHSHVKHSQVIQDLNATRDWLVEFQRGTRGDPIRFEGQVEVQRRIERGAFHLPDIFVNQLLALAKSVNGMLIPLSARHGDFWPGNIIPAHGEIHVIDWEGFLPYASPFKDLFMFAITYAWSYRWKGFTRLTRKEAFSRAFLEANWFSAVLQSFMGEVLLAIPGMDRKYIWLFFTLFMMDMACPGPEEDGMQVGDSENWKEHLFLFASHATLSLDGSCI